MEQFSSCYFCGDAVDASLDEYPVVPASVDPEAGERRTIVLCTNCKRKLDPVVEAVVDAVGDDAVTVTRSGTDVREREDRPGAGADTRPGDAGESATSDIGTTLGDDEDLLRPVGDDAGEDGDEETGEMEFGRSATGTDESEESDGSDGDGPRDSDGDGSGDSNERTYTSGQRAGGRPTGGGNTDSGDADEGGEKRDITLSRLENTNVMRLLQNREFPVEREEFVTVASSAYEISPSHCEKVIDLAVKHDLLRESEGQLHAGSEWS